MNNKSRKTLHLVAGIYLLYLAFQLLSEVEKNGNPAVSVIGGVVFIIAGGYLIFSFIRALKNEFEESYKETLENELEETYVETYDEVNGEEMIKEDEEEELTEIAMEESEEDITCE